MAKSGVVFPPSRVGVALAERASGRKSAALASWRALVRKAADGDELTQGDVDALEEAADRLAIDDIEPAFNGDVETIRNIETTEATLASDEWAVDVLTAKGKAAAEESDRLSRELREAESVRRGVQNSLSARGHMMAELTALKAKNPRMFGE